LNASFGYQAKSFDGLASAISRALQPTLKSPLGTGHL
jgi:hypothetical protein